MTTIDIPAGETGAAQPDLDEISSVLAAFEVGGGWAKVFPPADRLTDANHTAPNGGVDLDDFLAVLLLSRVTRAARTRFRRAAAGLDGERKPLEYYGRRDGESKALVWQR